MNQFLKIQNKAGKLLPTNPFPIVSIWEKNSLYSIGCQIGFITHNSKCYKPKCNKLIVLLERIALKTKNKEVTGKSGYNKETLFSQARFYSSSMKNFKLLLQKIFL